jgi:CheY-like chemotaxis protein
MAWVLVTGEDEMLHRGILRVVRPAGHDVVETPDGATALQLLTDIAQARDMVVLLRWRMGRMDVAEFLSAVATDAGLLRWHHRYILLDGRPGELPADVERYCAQLAVAIVTTPTDVSDADGWADVLDAVNQAARQLPSSRPPPENRHIIP